MTSTAIVVGLTGGVLTIWGLWRSHMLAERSGVADLLSAIASFYTVYAVMSGNGWTGIVLHSAFFIGFVALASYGFRTGLNVLAAGLIAHGLFDVLTHFTGHPGPLWWPAFCGSLDIAAGLCLLTLIRTDKISP